MEKSLHRRPSKRRQEIPHSPLGSPNPTDGHHTKSTPPIQNQSTTIIRPTAQWNIRLQSSANSTPRHQSHHPCNSGATRDIVAPRQTRLVSRTGTRALLLLTALCHQNCGQTNMPNGQIISRALSDATPLFDRHNYQIGPEFDRSPVQPSPCCVLCQTWQLAAIFCTSTTPQLPRVEPNEKHTLSTPRVAKTASNPTESNPAPPRYHTRSQARTQQCNHVQTQPSSTTMMITPEMDGIPTFPTD
jgi:hypothetical protein